MARRLWQNIENDQNRQKLMDATQRMNSTMGNQGYNGEMNMSGNSQRSLFRRAAGGDRQGAAALELAANVGQQRMDRNDQRLQYEHQSREGIAKLGLQSDQARIKSNEQQAALDRQTRSAEAERQRQFEGTQNQLTRDSQNRGFTETVEKNAQGLNGEPVMDPVTGKPAVFKSTTTRTPVGGSVQSGGNRAMSYLGSKNILKGNTVSQPNNTGNPGNIPGNNASSVSAAISKNTPNQSSTSSAPTATGQPVASAAQQKPRFPAPKEKITSGVVVGPYGTVAVDAKGKGGSANTFAKVHPDKRSPSNSELQRTVFDANVDSMQRRVSQGQGVTIGELDRLAKQKEQFGKNAMAYERPSVSPQQQPQQQMAQNSTKPKRPWERGYGQESGQRYAKRQRIFNDLQKVRKERFGESETAMAMADRRVRQMDDLAQQRPLTDQEMKHKQVAAAFRRSAQKERMAPLEGTGRYSRPAAMWNATPERIAKFTPIGGPATNDNQRQEMIAKGIRQGRPGLIRQMAESKSKITPEQIAERKKSRRLIAQY